MATTETNTELGRQIVQDAKDYVLYSWSVQNAVSPIAVERAEGRYFFDYDGNNKIDNIDLGQFKIRLQQGTLP